MYRTIPDSKSTESITTSQSNAELSDFGDNNANLAGKWVMFRADGGDVTIQRAASDPTLGAGAGLTIADGEMEELFVDPAGEMTLYMIGSGSCSLHALYDSEG
ncbi:MAG: hypothetical protein AB7T06_39510 [Kofleriaceae bacterium]